MGTVPFIVTLTEMEVESLQCIAKRNGCADPETVAGLLMYRGLMDVITGRFTIPGDAKALRSLSLGEYA